MIRLPHSDPGAGVLKDLAPDLTPMLDILFILLVFFMLAVGQVLQTMDLTLPRAASQEIPQAQLEEMIVLSLSSDEDVYAIDDREMRGMDVFKQAVMKKVRDNPDGKIVVAGDKSVKLERLLSILTFLTDNGIQTANILMQAGEGE